MDDASEDWSRLSPGERAMWREIKTKHDAGTLDGLWWCLVDPNSIPAEEDDQAAE